MSAFNMMNESLEDSLLRFRIRTLSKICWLTVFIVWSVSFLRLLYFGQPDRSSVGLMLLGCLSIGIYFFLKRTGNAGFAQNFLSLLYFVGIPYRIYYSGGLTSPVWFLYAFQCCFVFVVQGKSSGLKTLALACLSIAFFGILPLYHELPRAPFYDNLFNQVFGVVICVSVTTLPIFVLFQEKESIQSNLRSIEKLETSYMVSRELSAETKTPVKKALKILKQKEGITESEVRAVQKSLEKVAAVLKKMSRDVDEDRLGRPLYEGQEKI